MTGEDSLKLFKFRKTQRQMRHKRTVWISTVRSALVVGTIVMAIALVPACSAQNLGWEGETGIFVTPLAYTASSGNGIGMPVVAFHYMNGGPVLGDFYTSSVTVGFAKRFEFGYTREFHTFGNDAALSPLWHNGFNVVHAKANLLPENAWKKSWAPAISIGFMVRSQVHNVGGALTGKDTRNGDIYVVASKTVTRWKRLPVVLNGGYRGTNAELWGLGGNADRFTGRAFGAVAFVLKGPAHGSVILGAEVAQQPRHPADLPAAVIPTTLTYAVRYVPIPERKLNLDFGIAQAAGVIQPGVNLQARSQMAVGISYGLSGSAR